MDSSEIRKIVADIHVIKKNSKDVEVINDSPLQMMGKGRQGAVFHYTDDICIKVFGSKADSRREYEALSMGAHTGLFPKVYDYGPNFIVMEKIKGVDLREYLQTHPLTEELSAKLIQMLITFKEIGFERIDHHKRQIYLQTDGRLRVIDVCRAIWRNRVYPYPRKLLQSLGETNKDIFLTHVKTLVPELYEEWTYYIRMEELSGEIYPLLLEGKSTTEIIKDVSQRSLITVDEETKMKNLINLVQNVIEEKEKMSSSPRVPYQENKQHEELVQKKRIKALDTLNFLKGLTNDDENGSEDGPAVKEEITLEEKREFGQKLTAQLLQKIYEKNNKGKK